MGHADFQSGETYHNAGPYNTMDWLDPNRDYGLSAYDQRHTLTLNSSYTLPFDYLLKNGLEKALLGGWEINGIYSYGSGMPLDISDGFKNSNNGDTNNPDRPNLAPGASNFSQVNFTLVKHTAIIEHKQLEFRAEFFNLFNHPSFGLPSLTAFTSSRAYSLNAGAVTYTTSRGRQIQLGMKFVF